MTRPHRRLLGLTVAAIALAPLTACGLNGPATAAQPGTPDPATRQELRAFYQQHLDWQPCGPLRCAKLTVPMDYAHPENGRTFVLPVVQAPTTQPGTRIGSLVLNPGGPGASGVELVKADPAKVVSAEARAHFDVVSFDPRGVAGSKPAVDCTAPDSPGAAPDPDERAAALADAQRTLAACRAHSGELLPHVGTRDAARDLDVLRAALGDQKLTYLGWSYGTSLGTTYAELFPARVRALVLDGAVDPAQDWAQRTIGQSVGFQRALRDYTEKCAATVGDACPEGGNPVALDRFVADLFTRVSRHPLKIAGSEDTLDIGRLQDAVAMSMYSPEAQWRDLSDALRAAANGDGGKLAALASGESPAPDPGDGNDPNADNSNGSGGSDGAAPAKDNESAAMQAVNCLDIPHPHDPQAYWDLLGKARDAAGVFGTSAVYSELGCRDWPTGDERPHRVHAPGVPPVLVVGTTGDPATPYENAQSLAAQFPGGMLLTYRGTGHTAYGRSNVCVAEAVDGYLINGNPVSAGTTC